MKTKRICKSTVSLLLVFMMLVSMLTVGIVSTSAAETDVATTSAGKVRILFQDTWKWGDPKIHYWNGSESSTYPGNAMQWFANDGEYDYYYYDIPADTKGILFYGNNEQSLDVKPSSWDSTLCYYMNYSDNQKKALSYKYYADYFLTGSFNNWATNNNDYKFSKAGTETKYTLTKELSAGTYSFKIFGSGGNDNGNYYSNTGTITDTTGNTAWSLTDVNDCTLKASGGTYTFTLVTSSDGKKLTVTHTSSGGGNEGGGNEGGDSGDTDGTKTYFFGIVGHVTLDHIQYYSTKSNSGITATNLYFDSFTKIEENAKYNVQTANSGIKELSFNIYSVKIPSAATNVKCTYKKDSLTSTEDFLLDVDKVILLYEYDGALNYNNTYDYEYDDGSDTEITGATKAVYVGVISYISDANKPKVKFSGGSQSGRVSLISTGLQYKAKLGNSYWENKEQTFVVYKANIPADTTKIQLGTSEEQNFAENKIYLYFHYGSFHSAVKDYEAPNSKKPTTDEIFLIDNMSGSTSVADYDAKMFGVCNNGTPIELEKTVDLITGHDMWRMKLDAEVDATATFVFYRTSVFVDEDTVKGNSANNTNYWWGKWDAGVRGEHTLFSLTGTTFNLKNTSSGAWSSELYEPAQDTISKFTSGIWVDTKGNNSYSDAVKVYHNEATDEYHLYLPSYTQTSALRIYTSYEDLSIKGGYYNSPRSIYPGIANILNFRNGTEEYTLSFGSTEKTLRVYQSENSSTLMLDTKRDLYTGLTLSELKGGKSWPSGKLPTGTTEEIEDAVASAYKDAIETENGSYWYYNKDGKKINSDTTLKKIKGRGNSTFKSSMAVYGKYSYNITLKEAAPLVDGATPSTKWCLLANNVDVTMLRSSLIYNLARDINMKYAPQTSLVDLYDNGNYLGAYIITEKVEYGEGTLMNDMKNLDEANETANPDTKIKKLEAKSGYYKAESGVTYSYQYRNFTTPSNYKSCNFLLEFELYNRYKNEASWFVSPRTGQAVVVKYPEYANKDEMEWIIEMYDKAEAAIYAPNEEDLDQISDFLDVESFVKMYLIQELAINLDSSATSYYIHNNGNKLVASPVWDYDWTMGAYASTSNSGRKYIISGGTTQLNSGKTMADWDQMFVKNKALKTDEKHNVTTHDYNFQAKLAQNDKFWERCQLVYTNYFVSALSKYIDNDYLEGATANDKTDEGILLTQWLPEVSETMRMNDARWGSIKFTGDTWGTKVTTDYVKYEYNFDTDNTGSSGGAPKSYANSVYYLNDWLTKRMNYMSGRDNGQLNVDDKHYRVDSVAFTYTQSGTNGENLTIVPTAEITKNETPAANADTVVNVYLNGKLAATGQLGQNIVLEDIPGGAYSVYITAAHKEFPELFGTSATEDNINVTILGESVAIPVYFKSSSSYRYTPTVTVDGKSYVMSIDGDAIAKNEIGSQKYYWYKAMVTATYGESLTMTFTNILEMNATIKISKVDNVKGYYLAVDNMNNGTEVVNLTNVEPRIRNTCKSAVNMVVNDPTAAGLAVTSFDGGYYVLGDTDIDEALTIMDVTLIQLALAEKRQLSDTASQLADFDLDSTTSINDATGVQIYLVQ